MSGGFPVEFGRYRLVDLLAVGGMAELFLAEITGDHGFAKRVVIKRILPHLAADPHFTEMFISEAKITARLSHPKIAQTFRLGREGKQLFIEMEYVEGLDVLAMLRECAHRKVRLAAEVSIYIITEVLDALDYAHKMTDEDGKPLGIVHRDVSPSNILVSRRGNVKLVDFGIAHAVAKDQQTQTGMLKGKYGYMSPEQVVGEGLSPLSDLFSVGVVMAEMLLGRRLFAAPNELDVLLMVRDVNLSRLDRFGSHVPDDLRAIIQKALRKDPAQRYASAGEMREVLDEWMFDNRHRVTGSRVAELVDELYEDAVSRRRVTMQDAVERFTSEQGDDQAAGGDVAPQAVVQAAAAAQSVPQPVANDPSSSRIKVVETPLPPPSPAPALIEGIPAGHKSPLGGESPVTDDEIELAFNLSLDRSDDRYPAQASGTSEAQQERDEGLVLSEPAAQVPSGQFDDETIGDSATPSDQSWLDGEDADEELALSESESEEEIFVDLEGLDGDDEAARDRLLSQPIPRFGHPGGAGEAGDGDGDDIPVLIEDVERSMGYPSISAAVASVKPPPRDPASRDFDDSDVSGVAEPRADIRSGKFELPSPEKLARARKPTIPPAPEISDTPAQQGDLSQTSAISVLHRLMATRADGMLMVSVGGIRKEIFIKDGAPTYVSSNVASELLGNYLVKKQAISSGELDMALAMMPHFGGKLGDTLVGLGLMKPLDVFRMLTYQVRDKLIDVCTWTKGAYTWYPWRENHRESFPIDLDAVGVLGAAAMALDAGFVRHWADQHAGDKLVAAGRAAVTPDQFRLGDAAANVLGELDGTKTVAERAAQRSDEGERLIFLKILFLFHETELAVRA